MNQYDVNAVVKRLALLTPISEQEEADIVKRLEALAIRTAPPDWGYAGMLVTLAEALIINTLRDINEQIEYWSEYPLTALFAFEWWRSEILNSDD